MERVFLGRDKEKSDEISLEDYEDDGLEIEEGCLDEQVIEDDYNVVSCFYDRFKVNIICGVILICEMVFNDERKFFVILISFEDIFENYFKLVLIIFDEEEIQKNSRLVCEFINDNIQLNEIDFRDCCMENDGLDFG